MQFHPVTDAPEHVDFQRLAPGETIRVAVPVHFENEGLSPGLKRGGVLNVVRHTVEVLLRPRHICRSSSTPTSATLDFNDNVRWHDLKGTEGTRPAIADRDFVVATVAPPTKMAEVAAEAGGRAPPRPPLRRLPPKPLRRRRRRKALRQEGLIPRPDHASCCSGSASAIPSRGWPGTGTISASWRSTRSRIRHGFAPWRQRFKGLVAEGTIAGEKILALKPLTYMNESGESVQAGGRVLQAAAGRHHRVPRRARPRARQGAGEARRRCGRP